MKQKGNLLIRELCHNGTDSGHDMRVVKTDAKSHMAKTPEKCLQVEERAKKKIYLEACLQQRQHFLPFITSVDGLLGVEAGSNLKRLAIRLTKKWRQPYEW